MVYLNIISCQCIFLLLFLLTLPFLLLCLDTGWAVSLSEREACAAVPAVFCGTSCGPAQGSSSSVWGAGALIAELS